MKKIFGVLAVLLVIVVVAVLMKRTSQSPKYSKYTNYQSGPIQFKTEPVQKLDVAAHFFDQDFSFEELNSRSPVLSELAKKEIDLIVTGALNSLNTLPVRSERAKVELHLPRPKSDFDLKKYSDRARFSFSNKISENTDTVFTIDGEAYSRSKIVLNQMELSRIQTQQFWERLKVLQDIYTRRLLLKVAKTQNSTVEKLIKEKIMIGAKVFTDQEVLQFARAKGFDLSQNSQQLKITLHNILSEQQRKEATHAYITKEYPNETATIYFRPPTYKVPLVEKKAIVGTEELQSDLPLVMVFSPFKCGACGQLSDDLLTLRKTYQQKIRFAFVNVFPESDWRSRLAAEGGLCVNEQSSDKFWQYYQSLSAGKFELSEEQIKKSVKALSIDFEAFNKCFVTQAQKEKATQQNNYAENSGVTTLPTLVVGSQVFSGSPPLSQILQAIEFSL